MTQQEGPHQMATSLNWALQPVIVSQYISIHSKLSSLGFCYSNKDKWRHTSIYILVLSILSCSDCLFIAPSSFVRPSIHSPSIISVEGSNHNTSGFIPGSHSYGHRQQHNHPQNLLGNLGPHSRPTEGWNTAIFDKILHFEGPCANTMLHSVHVG